jgi:hypothetical protein
MRSFLKHATALAMLAAAVMATAEPSKAEESTGEKIFAD